jgi:glycosyltransferase involved in cell wall biosynthesis
MADKQALTYSLIIPVYNRPDEVEELLESLSKQSDADFEVVIVEDGSTEKCDQVVEDFMGELNISYFFKENTGPGQSRNYGFARAKGNYCIFLDSDCVIPPEYVKIVIGSLNESYIDAFGGPDKAHPDFSLLQKAINYSMTSFFTTGGIRGGSEKLDKFYPRSFNMGYSREVFESTGGFSKMRFGEDIDMSIRILKNGFKTKLIKEAYVYHKRRTNLRQFYKQVINSGIARISLYKRHPESLKMVHFAPAVFTLGSLALMVLAIFWSPYFLLPLGLHMLLIFLDSAIKNRCIRIGVLSILSSYIQLFGYGIGFLTAFWKRIILGKEEFTAFNRTFYK